MSVTVSQIIKDSKSLSARDRAFLAHCIISSLDATPDENIDEEWANLANKRYCELKNGVVNPLSWDEIKKEIRS